MHHIQRKILQRLMYAPSLNYAKMRPAGVESNHFSYHLEQLIRDGLIVKSERSYLLTDKGLTLIDRVSHESMTPRIQPHIVTSVYVINEEGQMVLYEHLFQPYLNLYGPPQGRTHYEEHIAAAAERELFEKSGLNDVALKHRGIVYIHATKASTDISKILVHVFSGTVTGRPELAPVSDGTAVWKNPAQLTKNQCMPGFKEVQKLLSTEQECLFFAEIETELV
jgi:ADP-ribose pyrophosphatase YjhB (NUDIX family)/predicted transcriptional regulator